MKKSIFILAALFAATMLNAQITLEHTFEGEISFSDNIEWYDSYGNFIRANQNEDNGQLIRLYNADDYSLIGEIPGNYYDGNINHDVDKFTQGIYTTSNVIAYLYVERSFDYFDSSAWTNTDTHIWIKDMNGNIIADLGYCQSLEGSDIYRMPQGQFKLVLKKSFVEYTEGEIYPNYHRISEIYSLPGSGIDQGFSDAPLMRHKNTRKYLHNDQVRIENADHIYTLSGQEVK